MNKASNIFSKLIAFVMLIPVIAHSQQFMIFPISNYASKLIQRFGDANPRFGGKSHLGEDVFAAVGTSVEAIANGTIMYIEHFDEQSFSCKDWGDVMVLRHQFDENIFYSVYGHVKFSKKYRLGEEVAVGAKLGNIGNYRIAGKPCWRDHLHFAIYNTSESFVLGTYPEWLIGYTSKKYFPKGYCNPSIFIGSFGKTCR